MIIQAQEGYDLFVQQCGVVPHSRDDSTRGAALRLPDLPGNPTLVHLHTHHANLLLQLGE